MLEIVLLFAHITSIAHEALEKANPGKTEFTLKEVRIAQAKAATEVVMDMVKQQVQKSSDNSKKNVDSEDKESKDPMDLINKGLDMMSKNGKSSSNETTKNS